MTVEQPAGGAISGPRSRPLRELAVKWVRTTRVLTNVPAARAIAADRAASAHVRTVDRRDRFFYVSTRDYLVSGLPAATRIGCALAHYRSMADAFDAALVDAVYLGDGLALWDEQIDGVHYGLALTSGNDSLYEGGATIVFSIDGGRAGVLSFSRVEGTDIGHGTGQRFFVTRKQQTREREHRTALRKAFARASIGELCMGAMVGIAQACDDPTIALIRGEVHPALRHAGPAAMSESYDKFWTQYGAVERGRYAYEAPVPTTAASDAAAAEPPRSRDDRRHEHIDRVRRTALAVAKAHRRDRETSRRSLGPA